MRRLKCLFSNNLDNRGLDKCAQQTAFESLERWEESQLNKFPTQLFMKMSPTLLSRTKLR